MSIGSHVKPVFSDRYSLYTTAILSDSVLENGYLPSAEHHMDSSAWAIAKRLIQREDCNDLEAIDWTVTPGRYDEESREILEDDNAYPY
jgi:hypothetical protein